MYGVGQRLPVGKQAVLVSVSSTRKLIDLVSIRSEFEDLGLKDTCSKLIASFETIEILKRDLS